jgi:hypothetical protein
MTGPMEAATWLMVAWFAVVAAIVVYGLLTGRIHARGLLSETHADGTTADRGQLLMLTVGGAGAYVMDALSHVGENSLPEIPGPWLAVAGASQIVYLAPKVMRRMRRL